MKAIAIKVESEREFKALMQHYGSNNWHWCTGELANNCVCWNEVSNGNRLIEYNDKFSHNIINDGQNKTILTFPQFASIAGIALPPNEIIIEIPNGATKAFVTKDRVDFKADGVHSGIYWLSANDIREIHTAMQSLNG